jgi:hypothetical protein
MKILSEEDDHKIVLMHTFEYFVVERTVELQTQLQELQLGLEGLTRQLNELLKNYDFLRETTGKTPR